MSGHSRLRGEDGAALVRAILDGDSSRALDVLGSESVLDVPRLSVGRGTAGIAAALRNARDAYPYAIASLDLHSEIVSADGVLVELRSRLSDGERSFLLPIAIVDSDIGGRRTVRIYHSERLITGVRKARRPVFPLPPDAAPTPAAEVHVTVGSYLAAIGSGDPEAVLDRFAPGAVMDNGVRPVVDRAELRAIFAAMTSTGGVRLVRINEFDSGDAVAFEYSGLPRPAAPGSAVRSAPGGGVAIYAYDSECRIVAVRMFDDFDPDALIGIEPKSVESNHGT